MNKIFYRIGCIMLLAVFGISTLTGCGDSPKEKKEATSKTVKSGNTGDLPNYRYVDLDTVLEKYHLAKDYNEEMLRMQTSMENELRGHESKIQSMAQVMNKKMQSNGYLSEDALKADQQKMASLQNSAQKRAGDLQANYEKAAMNAQKAVNDSIEAFIKSYNESKHYDAIFFKAATLYIDPRLDITDEVVKGLNERYNKIKK